MATRLSKRTRGLPPDVVTPIAERAKAMSLTEVLDEVLDYIHQSPTALGKAAATEEAHTAQIGEMEDALTSQQEKTEKAPTAQREEIGEAPTAHRRETVSKTEDSLDQPESTHLIKREKRQRLLDDMLSRQTTPPHIQLPQRTKPHLPRLEGRTTHCQVNWAPSPSPSPLGTNKWMLSRISDFRDDHRNSMLFEL